jgi:hypothetical protein
LTGEFYSLRVTTSDGPNSGHIVEAAIDGFQLETVTGVEEIAMDVEIVASPNPSAKEFTIQYSIPDSGDDLQLIVFDELSRIVESHILLSNEGILTIGSEWESGVYFVQLQNKEGVSTGHRLVKF